MKLIEDLGTRRSNSGAIKRYGIYECSRCNINFEALTETVKHRNQEQCRSCASKEKNKKHGMTNHRLNAIINNMVQRCENELTQHYAIYGGRGISVCTEWKSSRKVFFDWALSNGYEDGLEIDRINYNGNYEPSNCRWVTRTVNAQNIRALKSNNTSGFRGVFKKGSKWQSTIGVNGQSIYLGVFNTAQEASNAFIKYVTENNLEHNYS